MMTRAEVYSLIDAERTYQDGAYDPRELLSSGATRGQRDMDVAPGILLLDGYIRKAETAWIDTHNNNLQALQYVAKIAAIAVRILERAGGSQALLNQGLRNR